MIQAITSLEARGIALRVSGSKLSLTFPVGYVQDAADKAMIEQLKQHKEQVIKQLLAREDRRRGFLKSEHTFPVQTLVTNNMREAALIAAAINKGQAVLDGPVIYDPRIFQATIRFHPLVPPEWLDLPDNVREG